MENTTPETPEVPNTVQDLLNLQKGRSERDHSYDPDEFLDAVNFLMEDTLPSPEQTLRAAKMLVQRLAFFHFETVEDDGGEMSKFQRKLWKRDFKHLEKALEHLTLVRED